MNEKWKSKILYIKDEIILFIINLQILIVKKKIIKQLKLIEYYKEPYELH